VSEDRTRHFPNVSGSNLDGKRFNLPRDLKGKVNIVIIAFKREQTDLIEQWATPLKEIMRADPSLEVYELPTLSRGYSPFRWWIDGGMRAGIVDEEARRRTITIYTNKRNFKVKLGISNEETIYIFPVGKDGRIITRVQGDFTEEKHRQLQNAINMNIARKA
jgi:phosphoenolpyruvate carboxylase